MEKVRAEFYISGRVQGVGFRYFVYTKAKELGLMGYTKNLYDGRVETVVEGEKKLVSDLFEKLKQGPSMSRVEKVTADYSDYTGQFDSFEIR